jgi:uncharacterized protein
MGDRALVVAIHDVAPPFAEECAALWALCVAQGITPALFVVPVWHGAWPLAQHPVFARWIADRHRSGAEVLLHGRRHDEVGTTRSWRAQWRAAGRTAREGEFLTLGYDEALTRIADGARVLRALTLDPVGFVAPAWLDSIATRRAARDIGFAVTEHAAAIVALQSGVEVRAPAVSWSARTRLRATLSPAVAAARRRLHADHPVVRLALHPRDLHHRGVAASVRDAVRWWRASRDVVPYRTVVARFAA